MKKRSLVLWWWAAKWFVHIGILKGMEELWIFPDEIIWTSIWSIMWAFIASGLSSLEITKIAKDVKLKHIVDFHPTRWSIFGYKKIEKILQEIFGDKNIEDLQTKLKIVTADIKSCQKIIFEKWPLWKAIRWSVSIPFVFSPFSHWEYLLVDGWVISNLSLEDASFDNMVSVSCLSKLDDIQTKVKKKVVKSKMMKNVLFCMLTNNQQISILNVEKENKNNIILRPDIKNGIFAFGKRVDESVDSGYREFMQNKDKILKMISD